MSPESIAEAIVSRAIAAAVRRARLLGLAEAAAFGGAAGAISPIAGGLVAAAVATWRWRATSREAVLRALERGYPESRNLFITANEFARGTLTAKPAARSRVFADAAAGVSRLDIRAVFPVAMLVRATMVAALAWATTGAIHVWRGRPLPKNASGLSRSAAPAGVEAQTRMRINVAIQPPAYTGIKATAVVDPEQLQAIEGSTLILSIESTAADVSVDHDGARRALARGDGGVFTGRLQVTKTGYLLITADDGEAPPKPLAKAGARRMMPVVVSPDALPSVRLTAPGRDLVYAGGNARITFDVRATDDFGLRSLALRYTKVTGSGENFEFQEGEIPLAVTSSSARDWKGSASRSLLDLNLKDGDMLVYRAVAADARPGDGSASSDAFFIEISRLGVAAGDAFTLPEEESKYALSQQMLIVKTERLHQRRAALTQDEFTEQTMNLAVEQRMIRAEFVFMLGGEINDEEVEAEQSVELQAGRLQNRGQRDLRTATLAMSQAQKLLTAENTTGALIAERAAVTALQRAFSRDRYILRALATRSRLDPARRLTGTLTEARDWRRIMPAVLVNPRTALLGDVLRGIAELAGATPGQQGPGLQPVVRGAGPFGPAAAFRQRALVLAEEAIRIDPASALLRQTATELQRAAEAVDAAVRSRSLATAATAAASEARKTHADAPLTSPIVAPALSGAFADALRRQP